MNTHIISSIVCLVLLPAVICAEDERPILKESPERLVAAIQSMGAENVEMARINVAHDVVQKRLRIFSTTATPKAGDSKISGYHLEIIQVPNSTTFKGGPDSYRFQNNNALLSFAASQFVSGKKAFAIELVSILAKAEPDLFWSTPSHPVMTIQQILAGLQKDDDTVKDFLAHCSQEWTETIRKYGS
jgi:hypothetical protein